MFRLHCPAKCERGSDALGPLAFKKSDELPECSRRLAELCAQRTTQGHILAQTITEGRHWTAPAPGQGRAILRNVSKDTLA